MLLASDTPYIACTLLHYVRYAPGPVCQSAWNSTEMAASDAELARQFHGPDTITYSPVVPSSIFSLSLCVFVLMQSAVLGRFM